MSAHPRRDVIEVVIDLAIFIIAGVAALREQWGAAGFLLGVLALDALYDIRRAVER
jgi:hypothetical protein